MAWLPTLKAHAELFLLVAIFVAVQAVLALYRRRQLLRATHNEEDLSQRKQRQLMRDSVIGFSISFALFIFYCTIQLISIHILPMLFSILLYICEIALLSGFLIAVEKSKWRDQK